ncbi:serine/threonine-protein kinase [Dokdonella koreensis]|uniref:non-specific serine/threonine protein kinase n=1 Tax=Dokdonella koreensis DS-123 TaxID=1300342 RepID=A0A160DYE0_9GAMM|nr:serine/threonine-protein kinase [Dokdonella koreensis]ANB19401.1 Serine/threonine protein kinase [Dokdonella koreensis DS-123]
MKQRVGHYDIVAELGRGGMGVVYKGFEAALNRYVAIKVLADSLADDPAVRERFLREARSMAALNDPHIIQIHAIGEDAGHPYFVMEFVEGESLGSLLKREGRLTLEQSLKVIHQTASGLATAHDRGVVHRDIKPGNLMVSSRGAIKIADFGIALSNHDLSKKLTTTGEFVGTPGYLSPEVCLGKPVDRRSDIFSLGIVLFEMLTGKMPFTDESPLGLMLEVVRAEIPDVRQLNANVDEETSRILSRMIAKDPASRYQDCHELAADLQRNPLVARSGPITLQPKLSPAAATVIGQKTPLPSAVTTPITAPTPIRPSAGAPTHISAGAAVAPPVPGAPARPSVLDRPTVHASAPKRTSALPWAIAALLVLAAGAGAWTLRDRIPGLAGPTTTSTQTITATAATADAPASASISSVVTPPIPAPPPSGPSDPAAGSTPSPADTAAVVPTPDTAAPQAPGATTGAAPPEDTTAGARAQSDPPPASPAEPPAPRAAQADVEALRNLPAAQAESGAPPQIAKAPPPPKPAAPAKPRVPTVAVVFGGDEVIAEPARDAITDLLQSRGFRVIEAGSVSGSQPNLKALSGRADAVVFVQARPVGSQEIHYYGQSSTLYTVQVAVKAYRVGDGSVLWSSPAEQVNFTTLNAAEKAREVVDPMLDAVDRNLAEFRPGRRG